jgi:hypothetical protein
MGCEVDPSCIAIFFFHLTMLYLFYDQPVSLLAFIFLGFFILSVVDFFSFLLDLLPTACLYFLFYSFFLILSFPLLLSSGDLRLCLPSSSGTGRMRIGRGGCFATWHCSLSHLLSWLPPGAIFLVPDFLIFWYRSLILKFSGQPTLFSLAIALNLLLMFSYQFWWFNFSFSGRWLMFIDFSPLLLLQNFWDRLYNLLWYHVEFLRVNRIRVEKERWWTEISLYYFIVVYLSSLYLYKFFF